MAPVYTFRIAYIDGPPVTKTFTVPDGKRVVVKNVAANHEASVAAAVYVAVHGVYATRVLLPVAGPPVSVDMMQVAYERETVMLISTGAALWAMLTGYIFDDPVGKPPELKPVDPSRAPERPTPTEHPGR
jgi:hypothetical protein